ncbi:fimbrial protein [Citrobacter sp. ku-bf4]|uniref:fimbrial protein n=1 Tax=Citrobacter TaxID=544 RepID=UPI0019826FB3|nr:MULTISPECIES: fimbrial protein [Citrobacter]MBN6044527.1 fimbrial protein [Citrobacter sp. ku-bf4]MBS0825904.1 fimbrial protein [Citrobacter amalonaticus]
MKYIFSAIIFSVSMSVSAADGICHSTSGQNKYTVFVNEMLAGHRQQDKSLPDVRWSESPYQLSCVCSPAFRHDHVTWKATTNLAPFNEKKYYYQVNDYLAVRTNVNVQGEEWEHYVPFDGAIDSAPLHGDCQRMYETTGTSGSLSLYLRKSVSGQIHIPRTRLFQLFATTHESSGAPNDGFGHEPISELWLEGDITGPASCVINDGNIIHVDLHAVNRNALNQRGKKPDRYSDERVKISLKCMNVNEAVQVKLRLSAVSVGQDLPAIKTSNPDVGIVLEHAKARIIPQRTEIPVPITDQHGEVELEVYPVNARGNIPVSGVFEATAGLDVIYK